MGFMLEEGSPLGAEERTSPADTPSDTTGFPTLATMACRVATTADMPSDTAGFPMQATMAFPLATTADPMEAIGVILTLDWVGGSVSGSAGHPIPFGLHIRTGMVTRLGFLLRTTDMILHAIIAISVHALTANPATAQVVLRRNPTPFLAGLQAELQKRRLSHTRGPNHLIPIRRTNDINYGLSAIAHRFEERCRTQLKHFEECPRLPDDAGSILVGTINSHLKNASF